MKYRLAKQLPLLFALALTGSFPAMAQDEPIYGRQLMTEQERNEYREQMQNMKTEQEREAFRSQHHEEMKKRAKERGVTLPEEPRERGGKGMGMEHGQGMDHGQKKGMGQGMGGGQGMGKNR
jgi:hypothetical protein